MKTQRGVELPIEWETSSSSHYYVDKDGVKVHEFPPIINGKRATDYVIDKRRSYGWFMYVHVSEVKKHFMIRIIRKLLKMV